jgi:hypothetical protein
MEQITLHLPAEILQRAHLLAQRAGRPVQEVLAEAVESSLRPLGPDPSEGAAMKDRSDEEVLAAADAEMNPDADHRLSELLNEQQARTLTDLERSELNGLMEMYRHGLLRKAQALREAVHRGLREPLQP